jgi:hypothetical protein
MLASACLSNSLSDVPEQETISQMPVMNNVSDKKLFIKSNKLKFPDFAGLLNVSGSNQF